MEIGALDNPLISKAWADVLYVDYADTNYLRDQKRHSDHVRCDRIVDVDLVWAAGPLGPKIGDRRLDWVVASHVVEHVPDPVAWLTELSTVLRREGKISLAVPDKRLTFDAERPCTTIGELVEARLEGRSRPAPRQLFDVSLYGRPVDKMERWRRSPSVQSEPDWSRLSHAHALAQLGSAGDEYIDAHCWVFTPHSFLLCMEGLARLKLIELSCEIIFPTALNEYEFFVTLVKNDNNRLCVESYTNARKVLDEAVSEAMLPTREKTLARDVAFFKHVANDRLMRLIENASEG